MRTVTFWPLVTAARMKSGERWMPVEGCLTLFKFEVFFFNYLFSKHNSKTYMGIIAIAWKNPGIQ